MGGETKRRDGMLAFWSDGAMEGTPEQVDAEIARRSQPSFVAEGWERRRDGSRRSTGALTIRAESSHQAAAQYALRRGFRAEDWCDGSPSPRVVIRVAASPDSPATWEVQ